jgi:uncharacterized protein YjbI with pentapeptide repeats
MESFVEESQQRSQALRRWREQWPWRQAALVALAGLGVVWRWGLVGLAVASGIAVLGWLIVWAVVMPGWVAPPVPTEVLAEITDARARLEVADARIRLRHDLRNGPLQLLTVLAVLVGAGLGFQQLAEDRDQASQDRDQASQDRQLTRQGQASEQFTRAIDQLGSSRVETRIGGIYGLDQIAEQAPENTGPVGEVLLAWVNSRPRFRTPPETLLREHAPDVQAALSVLTGRQRYASISSRLDLHGLALRGADLYGANLTGANLNGADLRDAGLSGAVLTNAELQGAHLLGATLINAHVDATNLAGADLTGANLGGAKLIGSNVRGARLTQANLSKADLTVATLIFAKLNSVALDGANLREADLRKADLRGAALQEANLKGANLKGAALRNAMADTKTRWPPGFDWRRAGAGLVP